MSCFRVSRMRGHKAANVIFFHQSWAGLKKKNGAVTNSFPPGSEQLAKLIFKLAIAAQRCPATDSKTNIFTSLRQSHWHEMNLCLPFHYFFLLPNMRIGIFIFSTFSSRSLEILPLFFFFFLITPPTFIHLSCFLHKVVWAAHKGGEWKGVPKKKKKVGEGWPGIYGLTSVRVLEFYGAFACVSVGIIHLGWQWRGYR